MADSSRIVETGGGCPADRPNDRVSRFGSYPFVPGIGYAAMFRRTLLMVILCCVGCDERRQAERVDQPQAFLAFVGIGEDDPVWHVLRASARRAYDELGLTSPALRTVAPKISSVNAQKKLIETLRRQGMGTLCVQVTEPDAIAGTLDSLARRGVRVVTMIRPAAADVAAFHAGIDDVAVGVMLADAIAEAVDFKGTLAVLHADSAGSTFAKRHGAFKMRMSAHTGLRVILEFDCKADPELAKRLIADTMKRYPRMSGWAIMDNWPLRGRRNGLSFLPTGCRIVAADPLPEFWPLLENGSVWAMVAPRYEELARRALTACVVGAGKTSLGPGMFETPVRRIGVGDLDTFRDDWARWTSESGAGRS